MDFPADYDTKMFPETRYLGMARAFAIWAAILFLLIAGLSWALVWTMHNSRAEPVLVSISGGGTNWTAVLGGTGRLGILHRAQCKKQQSEILQNFGSEFRVMRKKMKPTGVSASNQNVGMTMRPCRNARFAALLVPAYSLIFLQVVNGDFRARGCR